MQSPRKVPAPALHLCPVCGRPQTKIQRVVGSVAGGSTSYVCARAGDCTIGINLNQIANWVAV